MIATCSAFRVKPALDPIEAIAHKPTAPSLARHASSIPARNGLLTDAEIFGELAPREVTLPECSLGSGSVHGQGGSRSSLQAILHKLAKQALFAYSTVIVRGMTSRPHSPA